MKQQSKFLQIRQSGKVEVGVVKDPSESQAQRNQPNRLLKILKFLKSNKVLKESVF